MFVFGSGVVYGTPTQDTNGNAIVNPTPVKLGTLQDVSIDISFDTKLLYGQASFAVAAGRGKGKIGGKAKFATLNGATINSLFFGQTLTSSLIADYNDLSGSVIPSTPFTITPTPPNSGVWSVDLGCINSATGVPLTRVASAPTTGQYSVTAGAYLFAVADVGNLILISYQYAGVSTVAKTSIIANIAMGNAPTFRADFSFPYGGKNLTVSFPNCISSKLGMASKQDDFMVPEFDFDVLANASGQVMTYSLSE